MIREEDYKNHGNGILSQSYNGSIKRIVGVDPNLAAIVPEILEERKRFWHNFFIKHSNNTSEETNIRDPELESCTRKRSSKPLTHIQHWVDTGYFPRDEKQFDMDEDKQSESRSILEPENCFISPQHVEKEKANEPLNLNDNFSSSSVDTTAYILSNTNITKKAETMAIVEGAKSNGTAYLQNIQNIGTIRDDKNIPDETYEQTGKNIRFNDNCGNSQQSSMGASQTVLIQNNNIQKNITQAETNLDADVSQSTLSDNLDKSLSVSYYNKLIYGRLAQTLNSTFRKYNVEGNSLNISVRYRTQNFTTPRKFINTSRRKKLYTGRDSPVDLVNMSSSNKHSMSKTRHSLHPALDFGDKLTKNYKGRKLSSARYFPLFDNSSHLLKQPRVRKKKIISTNTSTTSTDSSKADAIVVNNDSISDSQVDKHAERNPVQDLKTSFTNNVSKEDKLKLTSLGEKKNGSNESIDLIPVIRLTKLSEDEIKKYTRSNRAIDDNLNITAVSRSPKRMEYGKHKKKLVRKRKNSNPNTLSTYAAANNIRDNQNSVNPVANLSPVVCLKRLSESEIQKYKGFVNKESNTDNLQLNARTKRLSISNVKKYKGVDDEKVLRKDILSEVKKSQDEYMFADKLLRYSKSLNLPVPPLNVIEVMTEDSPSESSTLLFYECDKIEHRLNNKSVRIETNSKSDVMQTSTKRITRKRSDKTEQETSKVMNEEVMEIEQNSRLRRSKTEATNQMTQDSNEEINKTKRKDRNKTLPELSASSIHSHGYETRSRKSDFLIGSSTIELSCKSSSSSSINVINKNNCKEISHNMFSSDEDDFVKLVHCPEDVGQMELKQRYETLTQEFNNSGERQDNNCPHVVDKSLYNKSFSKFVAKNQIIKRGKNFFSTTAKRFSTRSSDSSAKTDCRGEYEECMNNNNNEKVLVLLDTPDSHNKTKTRLCFKTKLFESDSESSKMSHCSYDKASLTDEE